MRASPVPSLLLSPHTKYRPFGRPQDSGAPLPQMRCAFARAPLAWTAPRGLSDLLSDLPPRVDTMETSCGAVAEFLTRAFQIFRALRIFRSYTTCGLRDIQLIPMDGSPKITGKSASKAKFAKMAAAWTASILDNDDANTPERRSPNRINGQKEIISPTHRRVAMKAKAVAKKTAMKKAKNIPMNAKPAKDLKTGQKPVLMLNLKPATKAASVHHPTTSRPAPPAPGRSSRPVPALPAPVILAHPAFVRPPPACPAPTTSPTQPAGRAPARPQPLDPPSRHPPDPVAQRPIVSCPRPTVPPCPPVPVRPSSAPGLSAWLPLRPPSPSQKGGFVVTSNDRNKDGSFRRSFSQLPQAIQEQFHKGGLWGSISKEWQQKYVDVRKDKGVVTKAPHPTPPSPQIFQNLRWLNMFGKMSRSLTSALVRCPSVWTPRPSHELSLHLLV